MRTSFLADAAAARPRRRHDEPIRSHLASPLLGEHGSPQDVGWINPDCCWLADPIVSTEVSTSPHVVVRTSGELGYTATQRS